MLGIELGREAATIVMLAAGDGYRRELPPVASRLYDRLRSRDAFYYVFLRLLIGWPESLTTWDILFLVPVLGLGR